MSSQQTPTTTHSVETPSGRISYASAGSGPVALFVHGVVLKSICGGTSWPGCLTSAAASRWISWRMATPRSRRIKMFP